MNSYYKNKVSIIAVEICKKFGTNLTALSSKRRYRDKIITPRQLIWCATREIFGQSISLEDLGSYELLGKRDHATVLHGIRTARNLIQTNKLIKSLYYQTLTEIRKKLNISEERFIADTELKIKLSDLLHFDNMVNIKIGIREILKELNHEKVN